MEEYRDSKANFLAGAVFQSTFMPVADPLDTEGQDKLRDLLDKHLSNSKAVKLVAEQKQYDLIRSIIGSPNEFSIHRIHGAILNKYP